MTASCRWSGLPKLSERVEQKFFVLPQRYDVAFALLRRTCREDPEFAVGQVNSLYFDTPDLEQHQRSDAGEFNKDKIRIRWYGEECDPHRADGADRSDRPVRVWLERKSRFGFASTKQRTCLTVPAHKLAHDALGEGILSPTVLRHTMAGFGFFTYAPLVPVIAISYWRYRFVEPETGFRISIDSHIRSSLVMPGLGTRRAGAGAARRDRRGQGRTVRGAAGRCVTSPRSARRGPATRSTPRASRRTIRRAGACRGCGPTA